MTIKNFGKIKDAKLSIKDLTVFAGTNSTGKSYASRVLYCMFDALRDLDMHYCLKTINIFKEELLAVKGKINNQKAESFLTNFVDVKVNAVAEGMISDFSNHHPEEYEGLVAKYFSELEKLLQDERKLINNISTAVKETPDPSKLPPKYALNKLGGVERSFNVLKENIKKGKDKTVRFNVAYEDKIIDSLIDNFQTGNLANLIGSDKKEAASVKALINNTEDSISINISPSTASLSANLSVKNPLELSDVMYLETAAHWKAHSALSQISFRKFVNGRQYLSGVPKYVFDAYSKLGLEIAEQNISGSAKDPLINLSHEIKKEVGGEIVYDSLRRGLSFVEDNDSQDNQTPEELSLHLTATGIVQLGILGYFIKNRVIDKGTILFIDEPEAHLHNDWQEIMMGALYTLKDIGVRVILATHSPTIMQKLQIEVNDRKQKDEVALNLFKGDEEFGGKESDFDEIDGEIASSMNETPYRMFIGTTVNGRGAEAKNTEKK